MSIIALAISSLSAQQKKQSIKVLIYAFTYAEGHEKVYLTNKDNDAEQIKLSVANILGPFETQLSDGNQVIIRTRETNNEGETVYPPIARVKIPSSITKPLLVLLPVAGDFPYKALVLDSHVTDFPKGTYKLINFAPHDIRGLVGKTKIQAATKKIISIDPTSNKEDLLDVHFQYKRPNDWKTFGRTRWINEKESRCLLCTYLDPITKRMKIRGLNLKPIAPEPD